uniref:Limb development membrane protein 1 like n=1 Tax=Latimeria chalumnae TaxID=7897 RepID=H3BI81_LATCH
ICSLLFASLYIMSYVVIARFKRNTDFATIDNEDATVNKIALWMCTFTLAVSVGAVLLLPFSIVSNEILLSFPQNYYIEWLNGSLIHGLWNLVFLFSNLSLVFLMPFAYFFTESEGFAGSRKGVDVCVILLFSLFDQHTSWQDWLAASTPSPYEITLIHPKLFICIRLSNSLIAGVCTPFGLSRMFTVTGKLLVKPMLLENLDEQLNCVHFEEATVSRKLENGTDSWENQCVEMQRRFFFLIYTTLDLFLFLGKASCWLYFNVETLNKQVLAIQARRIALGMYYPPLNGTDHGPAVGGDGGNALAGTVGFLLASVFFFFFFFFFKSSITNYIHLLFFFFFNPPKKKVIVLVEIIGNCVSLVVLSSAIPVFSRTLGITNFDLLGDFGRFNWLGNFYIVFLYNMLFAGLTTMCLVKKFTWAVQAELIRAFG